MASAYSFELPEALFAQRIIYVIFSKSEVTDSLLTFLNITWLKAYKMS